MKTPACVPVLLLGGVLHAGLLASDFATPVHQSSPPPPPTIQDDAACKLISWPLSPEQASLVLKFTATFADTGIYYSGEPPPQMAPIAAPVDMIEGDSYGKRFRRARVGAYEHFGRAINICTR